MRRTRASAPLLRTSGNRLAVEAEVAQREKNGGLVLVHGSEAPIDRQPVRHVPLLSIETIVRLAGLASIVPGFCGQARRDETGRQGTRATWRVFKERSRAA